MSWFRKIAELWQGQRDPGVLVQTTKTLPGAAGTSNLFTVTGRVRLTDLVGSIVVQAVPTAGVITARLQHKRPAVAANDMCDDIADISPLLPDNLLVIDGDVAGPMLDADITGVQLLQSFTVNQQSLEPGDISLFLVAAGGPITAGSIKWTIRYVPMDAGATIVPA